MDNKKIPTMKKIKPQTNNTQLYAEVSKLLPNDLHNLENPSLYLQEIRKQATTNALNLEDMLYNTEALNLMRSLITKLENDDSFIALKEHELQMSDFKNYTNKLLFKLYRHSGLTVEDFLNNHYIYRYLVLVAINISTSLATKIIVHFGLYCTTLKKLGTQKHMKYLKRAYGFQDLGCFLMTEMGHGSNLQGLLTTAHYKHSTRSFIIHTPHELGTKFWIGNLARTANYGVVFANLIINKQSQGIHVFLVQIRNERGYLMPGIEVGDCGPKIGLNGVDNGWAVFHRLEVPYDSLLDKFSQIDENGQFISKIKKKSERFALQLVGLSGGRVFCADIGTSAIFTSVAITSRYLSIRKQFGSKKFQEETLINYPSVQQKLIPHLSKGLVLKVFINNLFVNFQNSDIQNLKDPQIKKLHALISYIKCDSTYEALKSIQDCRELCGGHGYSAYSTFGEMIDSHTVQITWEGANDVLIQQTSKFLLQIFSKYLQQNQIQYEDMKFLQDFQDENKIKIEFDRISDFIENFDLQTGNHTIFYSCLKRLQQFRLHKLMELTSEVFAEKIANNSDIFQVFNQTLPVSLLDASFCYGQYQAFDVFQNFVQNSTQERFINERKFMLQNFMVYGILILKERNSYFCEILKFDVFKKLDMILFELYEQMIGELVTFSDFALLKNKLQPTTLGLETGDVYREIMRRIREDKNNMGRNDNWQDIQKLKKLIEKQQINQLQ